MLKVFREPQVQQEVTEQMVLTVQKEHQGTNGSNGAKGEVGAQGIQGVTGAAGSNGTKWF